MRNLPTNIALVIVVLIIIIGLGAFFIITTRRVIQMTFVKQNTGLLRSVRRWRVLGLLLALVATLGSGEVASAATLRTIDLNTGYDQWSNLPIAVGQQDNEWRVTSPPLNGGAAFVVNGATWVGLNPNLPTDFPNSRWISINTTATPLSPVPSPYKYEFYFTLPPGVSSPQLTMKLSSDDHITNVTLNSCLLFTGSGGIFINPPLAFSSTALTCFKSGSNVNVITVTVEDTASGITGLIVDGTVTYEDCDRLPVQQIPGLSSITFWESTVATPGPPTPHMPSPSNLGTRLTDPLSSTNKDFEGVAGAEFYDVFYSAWDGTFSLTGEFVTIEAVWPVGAPSGGGLNIARVDFNGTGQYANSVASFVALGNNALPLSVGTAVDGNLLTDTTMGSTSGPTERLRVTVGFPCPCLQAPSGMTAWWPLDEQNGAGIVNDIAPPSSSTVNNQGTPKPGGLVGSPNGPAAVTGVNGALNGAMYFAGPYLEVQSQSDVNFGTGDFTIDAWIKPVNLVDADSLSLIVHKVDATGVGHALYTRGNGAGGRTLNLVLNGTTYTSNSGITSTTWYHVAVAVKRSTSSPTGSFYINGAPAGTFIPTTANLDSSRGTPPPLLIGASFLSGLTGLPNVGRHEFTIDELEIFKRELDPSEIQLIAFSSGKCKVRVAPCAPRPSSMVAWWPMNDVTAAQIVDDIVGTHDGNPKPNGWIGSPDGPDPVTGKVGGALRYWFSPNRYAEVPNATGLNFGNGPFSIDAWINTDMGTQTEPIVDKIGSLLNATSGYSLSIQGSNNAYKLTLGIGIGSTVQFLQGPQITVGQWNYVAVTVSPPTVTFYVGNATSGFNQLNGNISGSANTTNGRDLLIGYNPSNPHVDIIIDELEIFNRALSQQEIQSIFLAGSAGKCKVTTVEIDIKPGCFPRRINPRSRRVISVAILTTDTFDATTVDPVQVRFGRTGTEAAPVRSALKDVDRDGDTDLLLRFNTRQTGIQCGDTSATLTGKTFDGQAIEGSDSIKTVGCR